MPSREEFIEEILKLCSLDKEMLNKMKIEQLIELLQSLSER